MGPRQLRDAKRGPVLAFDHFRDFGPKGPDLRAFAPLLARRMYVSRARLLMTGMTRDEHNEALRILQLAQKAPPSAVGRGMAQIGLSPRSVRASTFRHAL